PVEKLPDCTAEECLVVAGKAEQRDAVPVGPQRLLQALRLRPLAGAVDPFQSDEQGHLLSPRQLRSGSVNIRSRVEVGQQFAGLEHLAQLGMNVAQDEPPLVADEFAMQRDELAEHRTGDVLQRRQVGNDLQILKLLHQRKQFLAQLFEVVFLGQLLVVELRDCNVVLDMQIEECGMVWLAVSHGFARKWSGNACCPQTLRNWPISSRPPGSSTGM